MKKFLFSTLIVVLSLGFQTVIAQAKYVFYFIGDGMGVNYVNLTEAYMSAVNGERGSGKLLMTQFPVASFATSFSDNNDVTDSAASGTALASGEKTNNGYIGLRPDKTLLESIAEKAKKAGKKVGIASTVPINHATPAAFYGHQKSRDMYYEISLDLIKSNFDFFAGAGFYNRDVLHDKTKAPDIYGLITEAGYYISKGYDDYKINGVSKSKVVLVPFNWQEPEKIPNAIDRTPADLTLKQITQAAIETLMQDNKKGFFVMLEGGRIDWNGHSNDAAAAIRETIDMDEAIGVAYEFYKKHPKETLIVITADHETGGMTVGRGRLNLNILQHQKKSKEGLTNAFREVYEAKKGKVTWDDAKQVLTDVMGFWKDVPISWDNEKILRDAYEETLAKNKDVSEKTLYATTPLIVVKAVAVINDLARIGWATTSHSAGYIPVFAIGVGSDLFKQKSDNAEIAKKILQAAKY
ncbi:MAG: alkaline phosphatase [Tannerella sp.]|jgi:alkaline phosphatase|nr:alkaline phosphatase [Tannerella sp.]